MGVFVSTVIGYYLGQRMPENVRPALRGARNLDELLATITVSPLYSSLSGAKDLEDAERKLRRIFYDILDELRYVAFGRYRKIIDVILEAHAVKRSMATLGAIQRGIPPEERSFIIPVGFLTREAIMSASVDEFLSHLPPEYRYKNMYEMLRAYRLKALRADVGMNVKRMLERELALKTLMLLIRARNTKELAQEVEKIADVSPYASVDLVRRLVSAKTRKDFLDELAGHPFYEYIKDLEDPFESYFKLHELMPEIVGFKHVPVKPSPERVYCGLKSLEWEVEKLVSLMNMVVI